MQSVADVNANVNLKKSTFLLLDVFLHRYNVGHDSHFAPVLNLPFLDHNEKHVTKL